MQTIDKHFRHLTQSAFKAFGFAQSDVLAHWPQIVGEKLAQHATPERITWPRGQSEKHSGTLHLKVNAGHGLDIDFAAPSIIERVNSFLGYAAISRIRSHARHQVPSPPSERRRMLEPDERVLSRVAHVQDPELKAALARLGAAVAATAPLSPQPEQRHGLHPPISSRTPV